MPNRDQKSKRIAYTVQRAKERGVTLPTSYVNEKNVSWADIRDVYLLLAMLWEDVPEEYSVNEEGFQHSHK